MRKVRLPLSPPFSPSPSIPAPGCTSAREPGWVSGTQVLWGKHTGQTASSVSASVQLPNQRLCQEMESGVGRRNSVQSQKDRKRCFVGWSVIFPEIMVQPGYRQREPTTEGTPRAEQEARERMPQASPHGRRLETGLFRRVVVLSHLSPSFLPSSLSLSPSR